MIFTQFVFFVFLAVTLGVHWALRSNGARKLWLLSTSYFFYGYWDYRFLALIFISTAIDFFVALALTQESRSSARRILIVISLGANLGILGLFKYFDFFATSAEALLQQFGVRADAPTLQLVLPVGISFFTFQTMSYTIDVYRGQLEARRNFVDFATFVAFFPQLVAGPIVRAAAFLPQLDVLRDLSRVDLRRALVLFAVGYFKKACVADNIAITIDPVFADPAAYGWADRTLAAVLYSIQIFCDFSGYSDMAIATAAAFGYELTKNFDAPYLSRNLREFWQRWHISLSTWLRDYVYIPLGGNRAGGTRTTRNLMLTMLLGGLWHGANWTFVLWGFLHGLGLIVHRAWSQRPRATRRETAAGAMLSRLVTFVWVALCFTIFRCADIADAWTFLTASGTKNSLARDIWLVVAVLVTMHWLITHQKDALARRVRSLPDLLFYPVLGAACALLLQLTALDVEPFIYFQF